MHGCVVGRALSAPATLWQSHRAGASETGTMRFPSFIAANLALAIAVGSTLASAVPGGDIDTLPTGQYRCEKPGDISGTAAVRVETDDFRIHGSSTYSAGGKRGGYLLTGDRMVMTGGPFEGRAFLRTSVGYLRMLGPDGQPGEVRCVLRRYAMQ